MSAKMAKRELGGILSELHLTQADVARMMRVAERTVRRWVAKPENIPVPAREALRAWVRCHRNGLDWGDGWVIGGKSLCARAGLQWFPPPQKEIDRHYSKKGKAS